MRKKAESIVRFLVGGELGYFDNGITQWYYMISMIISGFVIWKYDPYIARCFLLLSVLHFATVYIFGSIELLKRNKIYSYIFIIINAILAICALIISPIAAFFSITFTIFIIAVASVLTMYSILRHTYFLTISINLVLFVAFVIGTISISVPWYEKIIIIVLEIIVHPIVDYLQEFVPDVLNLVNDAWFKITRSNK